MKCSRLIIKNLGFRPSPQTQSLTKFRHTLDFRAHTIKGQIKFIGTKVYNNRYKDIHTYFMNT